MYKVHLYNTTRMALGFGARGPGGGG